MVAHTDVLVSNRACHCDGCQAEARLHDRCGCGYCEDCSQLRVYGA